MSEAKTIITDQKQTKIAILKFDTEKEREQEKVSDLFRSGLHSHDQIPYSGEINTWLVNYQFQPGQLLHSIHNSFMRNADKKCFWVAVELDDIVGCIGVIPSKKFPETVEIVCMTVSFKHRNKGIAERLVERAERWAVQKGFHAIHISAEEGSKAAELLYLANGYLLNETLSEDVSKRLGKDTETFVKLDHFLKDLTTEPCTVK